MSIQDFIGSLEKKRIKVKLVDKQLSINSLSGKLSQEMIDEIKDRKAELLDYLEHKSAKTVSVDHPYTLNSKNRDIPIVEEQEYYEVSHAQRRMWTVEQFGNTQGAYNMCYYQELGAIDSEAVDQTIKTIVDRYEILRTSIVSIQGEQKQIIRPTAEVDFKVTKTDLRKAKNKSEEVKKLKQEGATIKYDLSKDLLIQANLVRLGDKEFGIIINLHHIVFDGWSKKVLDKEFNEIYQYFIGAVPALPARPKIQYKDYTSWQMDQIEQGLWGKHQQYWEKQFADRPAPLEFVQEKPRAKTKNYEGAGVNFLIDKPYIDQLKMLAQQEGASLFMGLLALVKLLLSRYTGQQDITVGTPIAGRDHVSLEDQLGFFVNTLALRTKLLAQDNFREVLDKIKKTTFGAYEHQQYPFDCLIQDLNLGHDMSRNPLFDVMVLLQNASGPVKYNEENKDEIGIEKEALSRFDMTFNFTESNEGVLVDINYSTHLFSEERMVQLARHFKALLQEALNSPELEIGRLNFLSTTEVEKIQQVYNDTKTDYPRNKTIPQVFEETAKKYPNQVAVVLKDRKLTYQELDFQSNQVAQCLRNEYQIVAGDIVGIMSDRSIDVIVNMLGVLKAGASYLPIDLTYPSDRIAYMNKDCNLRLMIHDNGIENLVESGNVRYVDTAGLQQKAHTCSGESVDSGSTSASIAYVMYTSGSTGQPKGVQVGHRSIIRLVKNTNYIELSAEDKLLQTGSLSFDAATFEIYGMLLNGGELHMMPSEDLLHADRLKQKLIKDQISVMWLTSSWFNQLADDDIEIFKGLRELLIGGEKISPKHVNKVRERYPELTIINGYGPTENTTFSICKRIDKTYHHEIPLGRPIANSEVYILDGQCNIVPNQVVGEIYLGGDGLSLGYSNHPELNAEVFINHPFKKGERLYKTGDLGYWLPNGEIGFKGRKDAQIKLRGFRIEPGEIESAISQHDDVLQSIVQIFQETNGEKSLVAYYTGAYVSTDELKKFLSKVLPKYMIPAMFCHLVDFPLTANGKLDYSMLPKPQSNISEENYQAPVTDTEKRIVAIWCECIGDKKIGVKDNFFEIGGHSLNATKMLFKLHKEFNVDLTLTDLFENPTVLELAHELSKRSEEVYQGLSQIEEQEYYAISNAQRRLWVIDQFEETKGVYNIPNSIKILGLNREVFEKTIDALIERHEILRTVFVQVDGEPRQKVNSLESSGFRINFVDLTKSENIPFAFKKLKEEESSFEFDLQVGPLFRITLVKIEDEVHRVLINMHHIISDGWSKMVLEREYEVIYEALIKDQPVVLEPLNFQYKDYSAWQKTMLDGGYWENHKNYWHTKMAPELPVIELPLDYQRPEERVYTGLGTHFLLDYEFSDQITQLCQKKGVTLFMGMMTFVELLLHKYTCQDDIIIGTPIAGRDKAELEDQIGFYVNTLALRCQFDKDDSISSLFDKVRSMMLEGYEHQQYPFDSLIDELALTWSVNRSPLFDVMVDLQNFGDSEASSKLQTYQPGLCRFDPVLIKFDLSFTFTEVRNGIAVNVNYNHKLFSHGKIDRMIGHFINLIQACLTDSNQLVSEIDYLGEVEKSKILSQYNDFESNTPPDKSLIQLFEEQVEKTPDNISLLYQEEAYTFKTLDRLANQMANYLMESFDVSQGDYVAVQMDESDQRIVTLLALLKLGCVYIPMDKEAVTERLDYIIENADIKFFIRDVDIPFVCTRQVTVIDMPADVGAFETYSAKKPEISGELDNVFAILYTSGSTGVPKGVHVGNKGIVNRIDWLWKKYNFSSEDVIYQKTPFVFDVSIGELFMPLAYGAKLLVADSSTTRVICKNVIKHKVTYIHFPPTPLNDFINAVTDMEVEQMTSLRYFIASGEALLLTIVKKFHKRFDAALINLYGPTEASIEVSYFETSKNDKKIPIGKPIANVPLYVLDEHNNTMPIGIPGEIAIGGVALSQGYVNLPEITEEKFIKNPFLEGAHERIYKTGDIGQWNEKGEIEFLGRRDNQTSINGSRIELEEVEAGIISHPEISAAAVSVKHQGDKAYLIAHYVKQEETYEEAAEVEDNSLLTPEQEKIIAATNATQVEYKGAETIHQYFETAAKQYAESQALVCGSEVLTYRQLNERANQLAHYMAENFDIRKGALVGICLDRSEQLIISVLAILKLGAGYVAVDKEYPKERVDFMLEESATAVVITDTELNHPASKFLNVISEENEISARSIENLEREVATNQVAYTMFTSGSTGKPKGVVISHESVIDYCCTFSEYFNVTKADVVIQQASFSFDTVVEEVFPTLMAGGKLIMLPHGGRDVEAMINAMIDYKATILSTTPLVINEINGHKKKDELKLRILISGGDALKPSYIDQLIEQVAIYNTYGPTEATVCATFHHLENLEDCKNIGKPISNHQIYLLNESMEQVAIGCKGEIYIGGKGLAIEYLNKPELTAQYFVQNPFDANKKLYKTGDMAKWTEEGSLLFLGRKDRQVKVNGYRVELNEIEQRFAEVEGVKEAVTTACMDLNGNTQLVGYYTTNSSLSKEELRKILADSFPPYMIPAHLVVLEKFPVSDNGKINHKALPIPGELISDIDFISKIKEYLRSKLPSYMIPNTFLGLKEMPLTVTGKVDRKKLSKEINENFLVSSYAPPTTATQKDLVDIWQEVLKLDQIGIMDSLFELGGNSLKATQIIARIHQKFGASIKIGDLFRDPTIQGLEGYVSNVEKKESVIGNTTPSSSNVYPVSFAQRRLWVIEQFGNAGGVYNMPFSFKVKDLDREAFDQSIQFLLERHEILRTTFGMENGEPVQIIHALDELGFSINYHDLDQVSEPNKVLRSIMNEEASYTFDLESEPLIRISLLTLPDQEFCILLNMHHIISDGASMEVIEREFNAIYADFLAQREPDLPALTTQYKDYTMWQLDQLKEGHWDQQRNYWYNQFGTGVPVLELPTDSPRTRDKQYYGGQVEFVIDSASKQGLQTLCQRQGATFHMGLLSLVNVWLYKYTRQHDIVIGSPIAGRHRLEFEHQLGFYVNTLALRTVFDPEDSFVSVLDKVKVSALDAYENQEYPFDLLVDELGLERDMSRNPLFDVMLLHEWTDHPIHDDGKFEILHEMVSKFDLNISFTESPEGLSVAINYVSPLYGDARMERMARHLKQLALQIVANPSTSVSQIDYLTKQERKQLMDYSHGANVASSHTGSTIHQLVEEQCLKTPQLPAIRYEDQVMNYGELNNLSNQIAHYLTDTAQIATGDLVGMMVSRTEMVPVILLGILKSGAAYVPLDPEYPRDRISFMMDDTQMKLLITDEAVAKREILNGQASKYQILNIDHKMADIQDCATESLGHTSEAEDLAYVIYTSGTTGRPKGVSLRHKNAAALINWSRNEFAATDFDITYAATSFCFDLSIFEMFFTLSIGKQLRVLGSGLEIPNWIGKDKNILINTVPSVVQALLSEKVDFSNVSALNMAGEAIPQSTIDQLDLTKMEVRNLYGPSEYATYSTCHKFSEEATEVLIGKPLDNTKVLILDEGLNVLPIGVTGEVFITGPHLSAGYINRPELTHEKFIAHPFEPNTKLYQTGDLAYWTPDGNIDYVGRIDSQVKLRGYRIELGEIETVLTACEPVKQGVVVVKAIDKEEKLLCGYYTGEQVEPSVIKEALKQKLPVYMIPDRLIYLEAFPLSPNGKISRDKLPDPEVEISERAYVRPQTELELAVADIWATVLNKDKIGLTDNFFEIGGQSLKAMQVISRTFQNLQVTIGLKDVFAHPVMKDLCDLIRSKKDFSESSITQVELDTNESNELPLSSYPEKESYPVSFAQRRLWVIDQFDEAKSAYNIPYIFGLKSLDRSSFDKSIYHLIERHEILRTKFDVELSEPIQIVVSPEALDFKVEYVDLSDELHPNEKAHDLQQQDEKKPFDLTNGPLLRVTVYCMGKDRFQAVLIMHHIIYDAWSANVLEREFNEIYTSLAEGREPKLAPLPVQYKDYTLWQREQFDRGYWEQHRAYWHKQFSESQSATPLVSDFVRPRTRTYNGNTCSFVLEEKVHRKFQQLCSDRQVTSYVGLLSLVTVLLHKYSAEIDITIGTPMAGRNSLELEDQLGFYVNTLAIRNRFEADDSFTSLLEKTKKVFFEAWEHQQYPFDLLVDELALDRDMSRSPLFDIMLVHQTDGYEIHEVEDISTSKDEVAKFDLTFGFSERTSGLSVEINYNRDLFAEGRMMQMARHLRQLFYALVAGPDLPLSKLDYLSPEERKRLLVDYNNTQVDYPRDKTIVSMFEDQVLLHASKPALIVNNHIISYEELNAQANKLARYLITNIQIKSGERVGLSMERSAEAIISILAVMKAGGVYLPIDPKYPEERKQYMINDADIKVLLTNSASANETFFDRTILVVDQLLDEIDTSELNPEVEINANDPAYLIYTSGSTGVPKGVLVAHTSNVNMTLDLMRNFQVTSEDRMLQFASLSFDASILEIFTSLYSGATLVLAPDQIIKDTDKFIPYLKEKVVSIGLLPPSYLSILNGADLEFMRALITGGEAAYVDQAIACSQFLDYYNAYGPTECAVCVSTYKVNQDDIQRGQLPIGKPMSNTKFYILDTNLQLVPEGMIGEICISGANLALCYLNNPEKTNEVFIDNPFKEDRHERLYKTGDLGRWLPDGNVEYLGRKDDQVKIRGFRIELGEVESQLATIDEVKEVAVLVKTQENNKYLVAYYVADYEISDAEWRRKLADKLPDHMKPNYFVHLERLPQTHNGKVDRKALPNPKIKVRDDYVAPSTLFEKNLVEIWASVLKLDPEVIGVGSNFFSLGGHSLNATQITSAIFKTLLVNISIKDIFNYPTIAELSKFIETQNGESSLLVRLNETTVRCENVFFIPPILGSSTIFSGLANQLNTSFNVYGLQYKGFDMEEAFDKSIEQMAETFISELKKIEKSKIVHLVGYSMGVSIVFEMAKILENEGFDVKLVLLDRGIGAGDLGSDQSVDLKSLAMELFDEELAPWVQEIKPQDLDRVKKLIINNLEIINSYEVGETIKASMMAIEASQNEMPSKMIEWSSFTQGDFDLRRIPTDHYGLLNDENLPVLAKHITKALKSS